MKTTILSLLFLFAGLFSWQTNAQVRVSSSTKLETKMDSLQQQKKDVEKYEKDKLREEVEAVNQKLESGKITSAEAEQQKQNLAEKRAQNIENKLDIIDAQIALAQRNASDGDSTKTYRVDIDYDSKKKKQPKETEEDREPNRTNSYFVLALGLNNALIDGNSLDDSPYKIGGSRFFEIGYEFSTALIQSGFIRLNYGLSFQFNGLKLKDNLYFVEDGDQTNLQEFEYKLDKSKFRMDNLVIPVHFEFGKTNDSYYSEYFKVGLGGYAGVNLHTLQKLKYKKDGHHHKDKVSDDFNTHNLIYGLSGYIGYDNLTLYVKYDLNTIFKDNVVEQNNISAGLRFTF